MPIQEVYNPLLAHCIGMAVQNAWNLHCKHGGNLNQLSLEELLLHYCSKIKEDHRIKKVTRVAAREQLYDMIVWTIFLFPRRNKSVVVSATKELRRDAQKIIFLQYNVCIYAYCTKYI